MDHRIEIGRQEDVAAPSSALAYLDPHYWDQRFSSEEHYEWLKEYSHFRHLIQKHIKSTDSVLELGCGNSQLCEELHKDGITEVTCTDISTVAVERMQKRLLNEGYKDVKVLEADMLDLPFDRESFDVVIEKGTMDVLFVDSGDPWNPKPAAVNKVMAMLENVHKVLKPDGTFISISFGQPHFRRPLFEAPKFTWSFEWSTFGDGFHYFFYTLKKMDGILPDILNLGDDSTTIQMAHMARDRRTARGAVRSWTHHPSIYCTKSWIVRIISSEPILTELEIGVDILSLRSPTYICNTRQPILKSLTQALFQKSYVINYCAFHFIEDCPGFLFLIVWAVT